MGDGKWPPPGVDWYYVEDNICIACADCRDILPHLPKVDLVLTDPPYNVGIEYGEHNDNMGEEEWAGWAKSWLLPCIEMSETVLMSTGHMRLPQYAKIRPWAWLLCWWKPSAMGRCSVGFSNWEPVAMWGRGGKNGCDFIKAQIIPDRSLSGHPCPKPVEFGRALISLFPKANTILDPFMGSGTTLVAAKQLGRKAIGIEIEKKYCDIAISRLQQQVFNFNEGNNEKQTERIQGSLLEEVVQQE